MTNLITKRELVVCCLFLKFYEIGLWLYDLQDGCLFISVAWWALACWICPFLQVGSPSANQFWNCIKWCHSSVRFVSRPSLPTCESRGCRLYWSSSPYSIAHSARPFSSSVISSNTHRWCTFFPGIFSTWIFTSCKISLFSSLLETNA